MSGSCCDSSLSGGDESAGSRTPALLCITREIRVSCPALHVKATRRWLGWWEVTWQGGWKSRVGHVALGKPTPCQLSSNTWEAGTCDALHIESKEVGVFIQEPPRKRSLYICRPGSDSLCHALVHTQRLSWVGEGGVSLPYPRLGLLIIESFLCKCFSSDINQKSLVRIIAALPTLLPDKPMLCRRLSFVYATSTSMSTHGASPELGTGKGASQDPKHSDVLPSASFPSSEGGTVHI